MKGIILAGGTGSRLYPATIGVSKQLLPIYDKPTIYYPLSVLMLAGIREILIISNPEYIDAYKKLLGSGEDIGLKFFYAVQDKPRGLADAFIVGKDFIGDDSVCLILGDNVLYGMGLTHLLQHAQETLSGAVIFGTPVANPSEFGVVEFDDDFKVLSIEEKPNEPKSEYAVPGLYFYSNEVIDIAKNVKPSPRGEIEITSVNKEYMKRGTLKVQLLGRGIAWLDTGSARTLNQASSFVRTIQDRQGLYIACIEEIAYKQGYISKEQLCKLGERYPNTDYGNYIIKLARRKF